MDHLFWPFRIIKNSPTYLFFMLMHSLCYCYYFHSFAITFIDSSSGEHTRSIDWLLLWLSLFTPIYQLLQVLSDVWVPCLVTSSSTLASHWLMYINIMITTVAGSLTGLKLYKLSPNENTNTQKIYSHPYLPEGKHFYSNS